MSTTPLFKGRHLDEHHEETKGIKGWTLPTRRSVTWLVYLNDNWLDSEGGVLRCFPRSDSTMKKNTVQVGCHEGNLQVGWINGSIPVFLDVFRPSGGAALYQLIQTSKEEEGEREGNDEEENAIKYKRRILSAKDFDVPSQPIDFSIFLNEEVKGSFEQISTSRLDPRFVSVDTTTATTAKNNNTAANDKKDFDCSDERTILDVKPTAGTLVLFDSVSLPHLVREVTGKRQRIAATGWFHEDSQFVCQI